MRRPLCAFCLSALGVLALCSFLPQMGLLLPSAAIFVVFCLLVWWKGGAARGYAVCLLLGVVLGVGIMEMTGARLAKIQDAYAGRDVTLTAEVESTGRAYTAGRVSAVLMVEKVDGEAVHFRVECASLPKCEAGGRIRGRFSLDVPDATQRLDDYADGIVLSAEYLSGMLRLGPSESFRARTARLQAALSRALRKGMAENTGGVLAAMVVGDRSHLTSTLRSAYRGAGLSHVLVVSGLHVTIFCGLLDALPHKERERSRAYRRSGPERPFCWWASPARRPLSSGRRWRSGSAPSESGWEARRIRSPRWALQASLCVWATGTRSMTWASSCHLRQ